MAKRVLRSGVRFDCPQCGKLWKNDLEHARLVEKGCPACGADLRLVAVGDNPTFVDDAITREA